MNVATLRLAEFDYRRLQLHLKGDGSGCEEAAFLFCLETPECEPRGLEAVELWLLPEVAFAARSDCYLELSDETRSRLFKRAHDLGAALVEVHSHPLQETAAFSRSDLRGFEEFVPHARWRLSGRPFAAFVFTDITFDSLAWLGAAGVSGSCSLRVGGSTLTPTGRTYASLETAR